MRGWQTASRRETSVSGFRDGRVNLRSRKLRGQRSCPRGQQLLGIRLQRGPLETFRKRQREKIVDVATHALHAWARPVRPPQELRLELGNPREVSEETFRRNSREIEPHPFVPPQDEER